MPMGAVAAGDALLRGILEGCIAGGDADIQRRPYHKNCKCALHRRTAGAGGRCAVHSAAGRSNLVSYPIRRTWSESSLVLMTTSKSSTAAAATDAVPSGPTPAGKITRTRTELVLCEEDEESDGGLLS